MKIYTKINLYTLVFTILLGVAVFILMLLGCFSECSNFMTEGLMRPIMSFSLGLFFILGFLLLFKPQIFKHWLLFIASWYLPLSLYLVSQTSVNSGNILSADRSTAALFLMGGLFGLTVLFVVLRWVIVQVIYRVQKS